MGADLINASEAWEKTGEENGKAISRLRVYLENLVAEFQPSGLRNAGRHSLITINSSSWTPIPSSPLSDRNAIAIQNNTEETIKINYSNTVTGFVGMTVKRNAERFYDIKDSIVLYAKCENGTVNLDVEELS